MAKITANGDREDQRWRRTTNSRPDAPYEMLLTERGRLLYKALRTDGWTLRRRNVTRAQASAQAAVFGMDG